jgi:hypothetical protein
MAEEHPIKHAATLLDEAYEEFRQVRSIAWAVDLLLLDQADLSISKVEYQERLCHLVMLIKDKCNSAASKLDTESVKMNRLAELVK